MVNLCSGMVPSVNGVLVSSLDIPLYNVLLYIGTYKTVHQRTYGSKLVYYNIYNYI